MTIQDLDRNIDSDFVDKWRLTLSSQTSAFAHYAIFSSAAHRNGAQTSNK